MAKGDHIYVTRPLGYTHHGIDCGDGTVIHFTGEPGKKSDASIARSMMADFALDSIVHMREYRAKDDPQTVIGRAESKLGSKDYNLVTGLHPLRRSNRKSVLLAAAFVVTGAQSGQSVGQWLPPLASVGAGSDHAVVGSSNDRPGD